MGRARRVIAQLDELRAAWLDGRPPTAAEVTALAAELELLRTLATDAATEPRNR